MLVRHHIFVYGQFEVVEQAEVKRHEMKKENAHCVTGLAIGAALSMGFCLEIDRRHSHRGGDGRGLSSKVRS